VEERLARVLDRVGGLPEERLAFDRDLVKHGEPGVALACLCEQLYDDDVASPADILRESEALALKMGMRLPVRPKVAQ
jgi:hypothetical protein